MERSLIIKRKPLKREKLEGYAMSKRYHRVAGSDEENDSQDAPASTAI